MNKATTIVDIAEKANVSVSTVSRVLNNTGRIGDSTRKRVMKIAEEMNYIQNNVAASMVLKRTHMLGVIVPDIFTPFYAEVIQGAESVARENGFTIIVAASERKDEESSFLTGRFCRMVDGIISIPVTNEKEMYSKVVKPIVFVDRIIDEFTQDSVLIDNFGGSYQLAKHLIENGHRKISIIIGQPSQNFARERLWGYRQALQDHDIEIVEEYIIISDWYEHNGYEGTKTIMQMLDRPTAILSANCSITTGCIKALRDLDIKIGEDMSLVGFDDTELARFIKPELTVINRPTFEMGEVAAKMLIDKLRTKDFKGTARKTVLPVELLVRESVKKLN